MSGRDSQGFGRFRSLFCPVHKSELKLFLPLLVIFFLVCFNYNILRAAKDSLVITAPYAGAEIIPFIKVWAILPMALLMTLLFTRLANRYSTEKIFYIMMGLFLGFFAFFIAILYPLRDYLHPHEAANRLEMLLPLGLKGFVAVFRNWTYTAFYIMAELWGTTVMTVLFWGFANEILNINKAKRFYVLILIGGNISAICAGSLSSWMSNMGLSWGERHGVDPWQSSLILLGIVVIGAGCLTVALFRWFHRNVLPGVLLENEAEPGREERSETFKMGLRKNFRYLAQSRYLLCIATIVLTYNICINLTEVTWKDQLLHILPGPNQFNAYMGKVTMWIGIMATLIAIASTSLIRKFSWTFNAMIPPIMLLVTGAGFFVFLLWKDTSLGASFATFFGMSPYLLGILFGSVQQCLSRASKYTIFDATKELAFIPLSRESKLKGKAAIDGVGSRLGKSGSALIYQALLVFFGTVSYTVPYVGVILLFVIAAWMVAVYVLGKEFQARVAHQETIEIREEPATVATPAPAKQEVTG